jgi:hypothetical protein
MTLSTVEHYSIYCGGLGERAHGGGGEEKKEQEG